MKFKVKVSGTPETPVMVYYQKDRPFKGKLVTESTGGSYYLRQDGKVFPALITGSGQWMAVIMDPSL